MSFAALTGPGAPFELATQLVRGFEREVFVNMPRSLRASFDAHAERQPDLTFMVDGDRAWTVAQVIGEIDRVAALLQGAYGITRGDRVALVAANSPEYAVTMWAIVSLGAVVTSLNGWWTGTEIEYGIRLTSPRIVVGDERRLARIEPGMVPADVPVLTMTELYAAAMQPEAHTAPAHLSQIEPDDPAVILFTSGTTGRPKGATLSHRNILHFAWCNMLTGALAAMAAPRPSSAPPQMATIVASPMFHISGMVAVFQTGPVFGAKLVFAPPGRWDPVRHLELTEQHGITSWNGVPTQLWRLLAEPDFDAYDLTSVKLAGSGGAPFPPELIRQLTERLPGISLSNGYGMSETAGHGTINRGPEMLEHPDSVGSAGPMMAVQIRGADGQPLVDGEVGEICLRTACVFLGYWGDEAATRAAIDAEGWYLTGDFGRINQGRLFLESRMRDLILRGGENIYPIEIEHRLVEHPDIVDAAVIGVQHAVLGQEVKAIVVQRPGATLTAEDVQRWAADKLARFKVPAYVEFRTELPYTESGKVIKHELEKAAPGEPAP